MSKHTVKAWAIINDDTGRVTRQREDQQVFSELKIRWDAPAA